MQQIPKPKARIGDVVIGDIHPEKGYVMFEVRAAHYESKYGHWIYKDESGKLELNEMWLTHVYKRKDLK